MNIRIKQKKYKMNNKQAIQTFKAFGYNNWNTFLYMLVSSGRVNIDSVFGWVEKP